MGGQRRKVNYNHESKKTRRGFVETRTSQVLETCKVWLIYLLQTWQVLLHLLLKSKNYILKSGAAEYVMPGILTVAEPDFKMFQEILCQIKTVLIRH